MADPNRVSVDRSYEAVLYGLLYASLEEHRRIHAPTIRVTKPHYGAIVDGEPVLDTHLDVYSESTGITFRITVDRIAEEGVSDERPAPQPSE